MKKWKDMTELQLKAEAKKLGLGSIITCIVASILFLQSLIFDMTETVALGALIMGLSLVLLISMFGSKQELRLREFIEENKQ